MSPGIGPYGPERSKREVDVPFFVTLATKRPIATIMADARTERAFVLRKGG